MRYMLSAKHDESVEDDLRYHDAYPATCQALLDDSLAADLLQFEILVAACGVLEGKPVIASVTKQHLAIFLAVSECMKSKPALVHQRLDRFATRFNCADFKEFRQQREKYSAGRDAGVRSRKESAPVGKPVPKDIRVSDRTAELIGWGLFAAVALLAIIFIPMVDALLKQRQPPSSQHITTNLKPAIPTPRAKARDEWDRFPLATDEDLKEFRQAIPPTGLVTVATTARRIAPFEIKASAGSHSLVKIRDGYTNDEVMTLFVRRGESFNIDVPLGTFKVRWTSGVYWYGNEIRFGNTEFWEAKDTFDFVVRNNEVSGYTITLYEVPHGNLGKRKLSAADF